MSHTPSSEPERWKLGAAAQEYPEGEHKCWCGDPSLSRPADKCTCDITPDEQLAEIRDSINTYNAMIHRKYDGSDPLVQEPGP